MNAYSLMHGGPRNVRHNFGLVLLVATAVLACSTARSEAASAGMATTNSYGSGKLYKTSVERQSEGDLSAEDLHQASLLTSQLLEHVNKAAHLMADNQSNDARSEIERAESLLKVVRGLLPTTVVTTAYLLHKLCLDGEVCSHPAAGQEQVEHFSGRFVITRRGPAFGPDHYF